MSDFKNEFSWSISRDSLFRQCRRAYYYNYYGYWGGWDKNGADEVTRVLYVLKNLQNRWQWKGSMVHHEIERVLTELVTTGNLTSFAKSRDRVTELMREGFRNSRDGHYWEKAGSLKNDTALFEHEYDTGTPDEIWKKMHDEVILCLENFFKSDVLEEVRQLPKEKIISIESMSATPFSFNKEKFFVKLDLAYETENGIKIVDWKTGAGESDKLQFMVYTIYAHEEYDATLDGIILIEYNLLGAQAVTHKFSAEELNNAVEHINSSIDQMKSLLADPDENIAIMTDFLRTDNDRTCELCKFKKICFELG
jgi:hypothetical protein